jgi:DNA polymerase III delta subunit
MITVLHGESQSQSRDKLNKIIDQFKLDSSGEVIRLDAKKITETDLVEALEPGSLFGGDRLIVIENLFSLPRSKTKTKYLEMISLSGQGVKIVIWNKKTATATDLKKFSSALVLEFKAPKAVWGFLDSISPKENKKILTYLHQAAEQEATELIFYLLHRRLSQLIEVKVGDLKGAPWQVAKLKNQANWFNIKQLIKFQNKLLKIDYSIKSGMDELPLLSQLDLLLAKL